MNTIPGKQKHQQLCLFFYEDVDYIFGWQVNATQEFDIYVIFEFFFSLFLEMKIQQ